MKTIFITISRGLLARNLLRSEFLNILSNQEGIRVVILVPNIRGEKPPEYFFEEFNKKNVIVEFTDNINPGKVERVFNKIVSKLVFSKSTRLFLQYHINKEKRLGNFFYFLYAAVFVPFSRLNFLKKISRIIDLNFFTNTKFSHYFDKYQPSLVFSSSIVTLYDVDFLKEAKRRKIKTISMPKSWDNLDKLLFRVEPDVLLVQNKAMKNEAKKYQALDPRSLKIVGFPQFDIYMNKEIFQSKRDYCATKGFNPELPILFLGSEGPWSKGDEIIFDAIAESRDKGLIPKCNLLVRPHFAFIKEYNYDILMKRENLFVDDKFRKSDFFVDNWDPTKADIIDFANSLQHCNMMITFASTLALDAACFNKPIIAINYGVRIIDGADMTKVMYETGHYDWVLKTNAVSLVENENKLLEEINYYLDNKEYKTKERKELLSELCNSPDGHSAQRIAQSIFDSLAID